MAICYPSPLLYQLLKTFFPSVIWNLRGENCLYLTFDDGPVPGVTPFVLDTLKHYKAQATFFCVGDNVQKHPAIFQQIVSEGHAIGNHTFHHANGWKSKTPEYIKDVEKAHRLINSNLFRPPYGKLTHAQYASIKKEYSIVMWDVLSKDYEQELTADQCAARVKTIAKAGSVVVFHDSLKAFDRMKYALPKVLDYFTDKGFLFKKITL